MSTLAEAVDRIIGEASFSGVVRVDRAGRTEVALARGDADRAHGVPNTPDTRFGVASAVKGLTALTVVSLVADGRLGLDTPVRDLLGTELPLIDDAVTVEHLLAHQSGIGDYVDEEAGLEVGDYVLDVPVHRMDTTEGYVPALAGRAQKFPPGERFSYNNSGYVVLALVAERASGTPFHDLVHERVCAPAGMADTAFLRSDELPGDVARGYLAAEGLRTNVLHLPVRGSGDGGLYSTAADLAAFWDAFLGGRIVSPAWVEEMVRPRSDVPEERARYGLGFWLHGTRDVVRLDGYDAGVSCRTGHDRDAGTTYTVVANTSEGAWRVIGGLERLLLP